MLNILDNVPVGFLDCAATDLHNILPGPTLIHLEGRKIEPLFVSVLSHGNEPTGLRAIQLLLKQTSDNILPRSLSIYIGNVAAAKENRRHLDNQPDYNRIWPDEDSDTKIVDSSPESAMMNQIVEIMKAKNVFASIDIHNNTGLNPHYSCINKLDARFFHLATLFSRIVVYFTRPKGVQSMAFAKICPAVTVECGKPDHAYGASHAAEFIYSCLHLSEFPTHQVAAHDMDLFHTVATVAVPDHVQFSFDGKNSAETKPGEIRFIPDLDHLNFTELMTNSTLGYLHPEQTEIPLRVTDEQGQEATSRYFKFESGEIRTARQVMPSMFSLDTEVIRQDCLGYLMERMDWQSRQQ